MSVNSLTVTVQATRESLDQRLAEATTKLPHSAPTGERRARTNAFMAATSRHLAAVEDVLVPEAAKRLDDDPAGQYRGHARNLEQALAHLRDRTYGELNAVATPLDEVWADVRTGLTQHHEAERELVDRLGEVLDADQADTLATRVYRSEVRAPTRAHPYIPHSGVLGAVARRVWAAADRFWDVTQNRAVPAPIRPRSRRHEHESLMTQFFTGDPTFDPDAPVFEHRTHPDPEAPDPQTPDRE